MENQSIYHQRTTYVGPRPRKHSIPWPAEPAPPYKHVSIGQHREKRCHACHIRRSARRQHRPRSRRSRWGTSVHDLDVYPTTFQSTNTRYSRILHSYPLITLSTRAQVESKRAQSSTYDAARRIVQREGIAGLYSGLDSALFGISVTNFVYYYCTATGLPKYPALD